MKPHNILKTFKGTQDGLHDCHEFVAGTVAPLSKGLAAIVVKEGWAEPVADTAHLKSITAPVIGVDVPEGDLAADLANPAALRETKVIEPEETKPAGKKSKK